MRAKISFAGLLLSLIFQLLLSLSAQPKQPKIIHNLQLVPKIRYAHHSCWIGIGGELITDGTWSASSAVVEATIHSSSRYPRCYQTATFLPQHSHKKFLLYVYLERRYNNSIDVHLKVDDKIWQRESLSINTTYYRPLYIGGLYLKKQLPTFFDKLHSYELAFDKGRIYRIVLPGTSQNKKQRGRPRNNSTRIPVATIQDDATIHRVFKNKQSSQKMILRNVETAAIDFHLVPDRWYGYQILDLLIIDRELRLRTAQSEALKRWLHYGGTILLVGYDDSWLAHSAVLERLLERKNDSRYVERIQAPAGWRQYQAELKKAVALAPPEGAFVPEQYQRTFWIARRGPGTIIYAGVNILENSQQNQKIWENLLLPNIWQAQLYRDLWPGRRISERYDEKTVCKPLDISRLRVPGLWIILLCLLGYLVLIAPVNFFICHRARRAVGLMGTIPLISLAFAALLLGYGFVSRGLYAETNSIHLISAASDGSYSYHKKFVGVFSGSHCNYDVAVDRQGILIPIYPNYRIRRYSYASYRQEPEMAIVDYPLHFWQMGYFAVEASGKPLPISIRRLSRALLIRKEKGINFKHALWLEGDNCYRLKKASALGKDESYQLEFLPLSNKMLRVKYGFEANIYNALRKWGLNYEMATLIIEQTNIKLNRQSQLLALLEKPLDGCPVHLVPVARSTGVITILHLTVPQRRSPGGNK